MVGRILNHGLRLCAGFERRGRDTAGVIEHHPSHEPDIDVPF